MKSIAAEKKGNILKVLAYSLLFLIYGSFQCVSVFGLDPERAITQFYHTSWTVKDGAPGQIAALAQTSDCYLWLGTNIVLYRFDGIRFERFQSQTGHQLQASNIHSLFAPPTGGLWIGFQFNGASFLKDGHVTNYAEQDGLSSGMVTGFVMDGNGIVWAGGYNGLFRFDGSRWETVKTNWSYPGKSALSLFFDRDNTLWAAIEETIVYLLPQSREFQKTGIKFGWVSQMSQAPDGTLWIADTLNSVQTYFKSGHTLRRNELEIQIKSAGFLFDKEGSLWVAGLGNGIRRVSHPERLQNEIIKEFDNATEIYTEKEGLTADCV